MGVVFVTVVVVLLSTSKGKLGFLSSSLGISLYCAVHVTFVCEPRKANNSSGRH